MQAGNTRLTVYTWSGLTSVSLRLMKSFQLILIAGLLVLGACKDAAPPDLIPPERMRYIIRDFLVADGVTSVLGTELPQKEVIRRDLHQEVLISHSVSADQFYRSYAWYVDHTPQLDSMFQWIVLDLQESQKVETAREKEQLANPSAPDTLRGDTLVSPLSRTKLLKP